MGKAMNIDYLNPKSGQEILHAIRYYIARGFVEPEDIVLDLGCGTGYGSYMLSKITKNIHAFDIKKQINPKYEKDSIDYIETNLEKCCLPATDISIAIEVLEHTSCPRAIIEEMQKKTKKFMILSYPQKPTAGIDPTHISDLTPEEVKGWIEDGFWRCIFEHSFGLSIMQVFKHYKET